jgi:hypothetical protein
LEKYDIQAAFPVIMRDWIKSVEEVWLMHGVEMKI